MKLTKSEQSGTYVRERCRCGAEFEMQDDGWGTFDEVAAGSSLTGEPVALIELDKWRRKHSKHINLGEFQS